MTNEVYEVLLAECGEYLGIAEPAMDSVLRECINSAYELCSRQTGADESLPLFHQHIKSTVFQLYADRAGELNNKQSSALSGLLQNSKFILRLSSDQRAQRDAGP